MTKLPLGLPHSSCPTIVPTRVFAGHNGVSVHERHNRVPLGDYPYSTIHSFGAPVAMKYKIEVESAAGGTLPA